jgi:hypothetical protein
VARYSLIVATQISAGEPPAVPLAPLEPLVLPLEPLVPPLDDAAPEDVPFPPSVLESSLHATAVSASTATTLHIPEA